MNKSILAILLLLFLCNSALSQQYITKNGERINYISKDKKKQGPWFFFDSTGNIILSCIYRNDSTTSPLTFYRNNDTAFIRYPKSKNTETFIIYSNGNKLVGNFLEIQKDSVRIEYVGVYENVINDSYNPDDDTSTVFSKKDLDEIIFWLNIEIPAYYMFGTLRLREHLLLKFSASDIIFSKRIFSHLYLNQSGILDKVDFPKAKNNLSATEEVELSSIFSSMQRWQPYFYKTKTVQSIKYYIWSSTLTY